MEKLFVLVNQDLGMTLQYQGVQAGHAAVQWLLDNKDTQNWNNGYLIYLEANNLQLWKEKLEMQGYKVSEFIEPDIGYKTTAISVLADAKRNPFKKLNLLGTSQ